MGLNNTIHWCMIMIKKEDIRRAIKTFGEWDNKSNWIKPTDVFKHHTLEKSDNALKTAQYIMKIMEDPKVKDSSMLMITMEHCG